MENTKEIILSEQLQETENDIYSKLHCLVGKTVYAYSYAAEQFFPYRVDCLTVGLDANEERWHIYEASAQVDTRFDSDIEFDFDDVGKTIFFTKEEAEARLKELQNNK